MFVIPYLRHPEHLDVFHGTFTMMQKRARIATNYRKAPNLSWGMAQLVALAVTAIRLDSTIGWRYYRSVGSFLLTGFRHADDVEDLLWKDFPEGLDRSPSMPQPLAE